MRIIQEPDTISAPFYLAEGAALTFQAAGLVGTDTVSFEIITFSDLLPTPEDWCCVIAPKAEIIGVTPLLCADGRPARLTPEFPVASLDGPSGVYVRAVVNASPASVVSVDAYPVKSGDCTPCICDRPCEITSWTPTGNMRCDDVLQEYQEEERSNCGDVRWVSRGPITWTPTGVVSCDADFIQIQEVNNCGVLRWVDGEAIVWSRTGDMRCEGGSYQAKEISSCCDCKPRWVDVRPVQWQATGETRCLPYAAPGGPEVHLERQDVNDCGELRWVDTGPTNWVPNGDRYCENGQVFQLMVNDCGGLRTTAIGPTATEPTGELRCDYDTHLVLAKALNQCGEVEWQPTPEICGYCPSYPLPGGGYGFVDPEARPPGAVLALEPCVASAEPGVYLLPAPTTNGVGQAFATHPVKDCEGNILGYAVNKSDCAPDQHPDVECGLDALPLPPPEPLVRYPNLTPVLVWNEEQVNNYPGEWTEVIIVLHEIAGVDTFGEIELFLPAAGKGGGALIPQPDEAQTVSTLDGGPVDNPNWAGEVVTDPDVGIYFRSSRVIPANGYVRLAVRCQYDAIGTANFAVTITPGSGGEVITTDNFAETGPIETVARPALALTTWDDGDATETVGLDYSTNYNAVFTITETEGSLPQSPLRFEFNRNNNRIVFTFLPILKYVTGYGEVDNTLWQELPALSTAQTQVLEYHGPRTPGMQVDVLVNMAWNRTGLPLPPPLDPIGVGGNLRGFAYIKGDRTETAANVAEVYAGYSD